MENNIAMKAYYKNILSVYPQIDDNYAKLLTIETERYYSSVIEILKPKIVLIYNKDKYLYKLLLQLVEYNEIPLVYLEKGLLDSTFIMNEQKEIENTFPIYNINQSEMQLAKDSIDYISSLNVNKKKQLKKDLFISKINKSLQNRPTIYYSGNDNINSGTWGYNYTNKKNKSYVFELYNDTYIYHSDI
ncbi:MAG: hypothetical protein ACK5LL_16380 [Suipraeoptans sp.]